MQAPSQKTGQNKSQELASNFQEACILYFTEQVSNYQALDNVDLVTKNEEKVSKLKNVIKIFAAKYKANKWACCLKLDTVDGILIMYYRDKGNFNYSVPTNLSGIENGNSVDHSGVFVNYHISTICTCDEIFLTKSHSWYLFKNRYLLEDTKDTKQQTPAKKNEVCSASVSYKELPKIVTRNNSSLFIGGGSNNKNNQSNSIASTRRNSMNEEIQSKKINKTDLREKRTKSPTFVKANKKNCILQ